MKHYDDDFKRESVELLLRSGKSQAQVARELGVSNGSLGNWKKGYLKDNQNVCDSDGVSIEELAEEIRSLRKENEYLKRQREILKKAALILGEASQ